MRSIVANRKLFILGFLLFGFYLSKAQVDNEDPYTTLALQKKAIIGTWVAEDDDGLWKFVFTKDGKCYWHSGDDVETYTYTITNFSPKDPYDYNLNLYGISDSSEHYGYEMYIGRDEGNNYDEMSLHSGGEGSGVMTPGNFVFKKIKD